MTINWIYLVIAVALMLPPLPLSASLRRYVLRSRRNGSATVGSLFGQWQNWVDFIRAGAGTYLLTQLAVSVDPEVQGAATKALGFQGAVLAGVLLAQTVRVGEELRVVAPIFYLCGMTLVLSGYEVGGFAVFTGWLFALGCKSPAYQLPMMVVALGAAGYVLGGLNLAVILNCGLIAVPMLLAFMLRQPMVFVAREPAMLMS